MGKSELCFIGADGCNFEMVIDCVKSYKYLEKTPLINAQDREFGHVEVKNGKVYIFINLPNFIRCDNIQPFSITDMIKLEIICNDLESALKKSLKGVLDDETDVLGARAKSIECNITQRVSGKSTCAQVLNLINRSFPEGTNVVYQRASSKCKYLKEDATVIIPKKNYYAIKCYDKTLEQRKDPKNKGKDIPEGLLRIEIVMQDRILQKLFGVKSTIPDVFKKESLLKVIDEYRNIFLNDIIKQHIVPCLSEVTDILFQSLKTTNRPIETIAEHKELIVDEEVLHRALVRWHKMCHGKSEERAKRNADAYICRHDFPKNVVDTIREFKKSCGE